MDNNRKFKVVLTDNYARESIAEKLHEEKLTLREAVISASLYNTKSAGGSYWAIVQPQDYVLWRGMADLV